MLDIAGVRADRSLHDLGVTLDGGLEELVIMLLEQRGDSVAQGLDVGVDREGDVGTTTQLLRAILNLNREGARQELVVGEIGSQQDQYVGIIHALGCGTVTQQTGHADVEGVVVLDEVLAAQGVTDRGLKLVGQGQDLVMGTLDAGTGENGNLLDVIEKLNELTDVLRVRLGGGTTARDEDRRRSGSLLVGDVAREGHDRDGAARDSMANGRVDDARCLLGSRDQLAVVRAFHEEAIRVGLLEVAHADLDAGDVGGDGQNRDLGTVCVEQTIDEVQVARTTGTCADSQLAGQSCLGSSGEGRSLLMTNVDPVDTALDRTAGPANCINDGVQGVTDDAVDPSHPRIEELLDELFGNIHERDLHGTDDI